MAGHDVRNPCEELPIYHNHCSDHRTYSDRRIDRVADGAPSYCFSYLTPKVRARARDIHLVVALGGTHLSCASL